MASHTLLLALLLIASATHALPAVASPALQKGAPTAILVPEDYPTIQEAVNSAPNGSIILVSPGTYNAFTVEGKNLTIRAAQPGTVYIAGAAGPLVTVRDAIVVIDGFNISCTLGPAVSVWGSTLELENSSVYSGVGEAILYYSGSLGGHTLLLYNVSVAGRDPIEAWNPARVVLEDSSVHPTSGESGAGGIHGAGEVALESTLVVGIRLLVLEAGTVGIEDSILDNASLKVAGDTLELLVSNLTVNASNQSTAPAVDVEASREAVVHAQDISVYNSTLGEPLFSIAAPTVVFASNGTRVANTSVEESLYSVSAWTSHVVVTRFETDNVVLASGSSMIRVAAEKGAGNGSINVSVSHAILEVRSAGLGRHYFLLLDAGRSNYSLALHDIVLENTSALLTLARVSVGGLEPRGHASIVGLYAPEGSLGGGSRALEDQGPGVVGVVFSSNLMPESLVIEDARNLVMEDLVLIIYHPPSPTWIYSGASIHVRSISDCLSTGPLVAVIPDPESTLGKLLLESPLNPSLEGDLEENFGGPGSTIVIEDVNATLPSSLYAILWPVKLLLVENASLGSIAWHYYCVGPQTRRTLLYPGVAVGASQDSSVVLEGVTSSIRVGSGSWSRLPITPLLCNESLTRISAVNGYLRLLGFDNVELENVSARVFHAELVVYSGNLTVRSMYVEALSSPPHLHWVGIEAGGSFRLENSSLGSAAGSGGGEVRVEPEWGAGLVEVRGFRGDTSIVIESSSMIKSIVLSNVTLYGLPGGVPGAYVGAPYRVLRVGDVRLAGLGLLVARAGSEILLDNLSVNGAPVEVVRGGSLVFSRESLGEVSAGELILLNANLTLEDTVLGGSSEGPATILVLAPSNATILNATLAGHASVWIASPHRIIVEESRVEANGYWSGLHIWGAGSGYVWFNDFSRGRVEIRDSRVSLDSPYPILYVLHGRCLVRILGNYWGEQGLLDEDGDGIADGVHTLNLFSARNASEILVDWYPLAYPPSDYRVKAIIRDPVNPLLIQRFQNRILYTLEILSKGNLTIAVLEDSRILYSRTLELQDWHQVISGAISLPGNAGAQKVVLEAQLDAARAGRTYTLTLTLNPTATIEGTSVLARANCAPGNATLGGNAEEQSPTVQSTTATRALQTRIASSGESGASSTTASPTGGRARTALPLVIEALLGGALILLSYYCYRVSRRRGVGQG